MLWSCPPAIPPGPSTWSTEIIPKEPVHSPLPWQVTRPSMSRQAISTSCPLVSPSWAAPLANQPSSNLLTPSSKLPKLVVHRAICLPRRKRFYLFPVLLLLDTLDVYL